ncbi:MAG: hypothetical protein N838_09965 [Thiohalocapsa sp. PB-PSB1]|jgi:hypothetical protein|nr:MAG: hypothetical protein N838_09965 [Thiohalocapsa sp. PB-PSB1]
MAEPKGWYSRGYLPHLDQPGLLQFVTFHLGDSLPTPVLRRIMAETARDDVARFRRIEHYLDAGHGACWLHRPEIATLVQHALLHFDGERYRLLAWVVMPNHAHGLIETLPGFPLQNLVQSWRASRPGRQMHCSSAKAPFGTATTSTVTSATMRTSRLLCATSTITRSGPDWWSMPLIGPSAAPALGAPAFQPAAPDARSRRFCGCCGLARSLPNVQLGWIWLGIEGVSRFPTSLARL